jgi:ubiquinone/menaquinone biosynthesis C-methylase UbiE
VALEAAGAVGPKGAVCGLDPNDAMLHHARLQTKATQVSIRWHTGDAESIPFRQRRFDAVLCQHGVQFFGDRKRGIHEMVRVLRSGGRVLASVWGPLNRNPWASAIIAGFDAVCPEWAQSMRAPFSMADGRELQELLAADCSEVRLERVQLDLAMPDPGAFVRHFLAALPFVDQMECDVEKLTAAILAGLDTGRNRERSTVPSEVWIASGVA